MLGRPFHQKAESCSDLPPLLCVCLRPYPLPRSFVRAQVAPTRTHDAGTGRNALLGPIDPRPPPRNDTTMTESREQTKAIKDLPAAHPARMFIKVDRLARVPLREAEINLSLATPVPHLDLPEE